MIIEAKIIFKHGVPFLNYYSQRLQSYINIEITPDDSVLYRKALDAEKKELKVNLKFTLPDGIKVL